MMNINGVNGAALVAQQPNQAQPNQPISFEQGVEWLRQQQAQGNLRVGSEPSAPIPDSFSIRTGEGAAPQVQVPGQPAATQDPNGGQPQMVPGQQQQVATQQPAGTVDPTTGQPYVQQQQAQQQPDQQAQLLAERERMARERTQALEMRTFESELQSWSQNKLSQMVQSGVPLAQAQQVVQEMGDMNRRAASMISEADRRIEDQGAKFTVASNLAQQYGMPTEQLLQYEDPKAMELAAQHHQRMQSQIDGLSQQVAQISQGQAQQNAPAQSFSTPGGNAPNFIGLANGIATGAIDGDNPTMAEFLFRNNLLSL